MSHLKSIAFLSEEEALQRLHERLRQRSDEELIKFGNRCAALTSRFDVHMRPRRNLPCPPDRDAASHVGRF
jgi:hypothetical protein